MHPSQPADDFAQAATPAAARERVSRGASYALVAQMVGAVLTAVLTIFLGRALSEVQYGYFTFALSVIAIAILLSDLGVTASTDRFLAEHRDHPEAAATVFRTALRLKLQIAVPASLLLIVVAGPLCDAFGIGGATWPLRAAAIALFGQSVYSLFLGAFISLGKIRYNVMLATTESVFEALATVAFVLAGAAATGAALGRAVGYAAGVIVALFVASRTIGSLRSGRLRRERELISPRQILSYARPLLVVEAAFRVFSSVDVLLIAALVGGSAQVAAFGLAMRLAIFLEYPSAAVTSAVAPRLARRGDGEHPDLPLLSASMRYLTMLQMLFTVPLIVWPEGIVHLVFGDKYPEAASVLRALTPYVFISGLAQLATLSVNYLGQAKRRVPLAIVMLAVNVLVDVLLLPRIGIVGGAIGTSVAYAIWVPAHILILHRQIGLRLAPLLATTGRVLLAGGAMLAVLALLGTGQVGIATMLVGALLGPAVYLATLFALGELTAGDLAVARGVLMRRSVP
jgi:O-antigen/teichoic acid export membrane protein